MVATEADFQKAYSVFLGKAWSSASNMAMAKADPITALNAAGFSISPDAHVSLAPVQGYANMDDQFNMYQIGQKTGNYSIVLPEAPPSVGHIVDPNSMQANDVSVCCCCCPCCSCT